MLAISDDGTFYVINASTRNTYLYSFRLTEDGKIGELTQKLYDTLTGIQWGKLPDTKGWIVPVCKAEFPSSKRAEPKGSALFLRPVQGCSAS